MGNIFHPFNLPIYQTQISDLSYNIVREDILNYINHNKDTFKKEWDCPTKTNINSQNLNLSKDLTNIIRQSTEDYYENWGFENGKLEISEIWINIADKGDYQEIHKHSSYYDKVLFSGVLYIETNDKTGNIILVNPLEDQISSMLPTSKIHIKYPLSPKNGLLLMFPSWLGHYVNSNNSNNKRISVSWNIICK